MELKQLNRVAILLALVINISMFSQMKMADIENKKFSINTKTEKRNLIEIYDNNDYCIYYMLDKSDFDLKIGSSVGSIANVIFFSKKYDKAILTVFRQYIYHKKKSIYDIRLSTDSHDKYMFVSSTAILDKDFNYEYFMKYYYMHLPNDVNVYTSRIKIQDNKHKCNVIEFDINGNLIYENLDDILSNIPLIGKDNKAQNCNSIVYDRDLDEYFPKKIIK